jgi:hypothetical protein
MRAQGTVKGILFEGSDGHEYLLGFSPAQPTPTPILSRRRPTAASRCWTIGAGYRQAARDLRPASDRAGLGEAALPLDRLQGGAEGVPIRPDLADVVRVMPKDKVRAEVRHLVHGPSYMTFDDVVAGFPMAQINTRPPNVPYTPWHLLEHMRIAQRDILDYIKDKAYRLPTWPDDYWPDKDAKADAGLKTVAAFWRTAPSSRRSRAIRDLARLPRRAPTSASS